MLSSLSSLLLLCLLASPSSSLSAPPSPPPLRVLVTGAGGKTGRLVFEQLLQDPSKYSPVGLVRSKKRQAQLSSLPGASPSQLVIHDVCSATTGPLLSALQNTDALIVVTSAVPKIKKRSIAKLLAKKLIGKKGGRPEFRWSTPEGYPENVDYLAQKVQFDLAVQAGVKRIVLVSSMGGTQPDNFLNTIGKDEEGNGNGDILLWKRKAEQYLATLSVPHAIIHPGGLQDKKKSPLSRSLVLGADDELLARKKRSIPRADVAALCVACLSDLPAGKSVNFDCIAEEVEGGEPGCGNLREALGELVGGN